MIQLHISPQTLVFPLQEVFGAPDSDRAVVSARGQVLPITAEIKARHIPTVGLKSTLNTHVRKGCPLENKPKKRQHIF